MLHVHLDRPTSALIGCHNVFTPNTNQLLLIILKPDQPNIQAQQALVNQKQSRAGQKQLAYSTYP